MIKHDDSKLIKSYKIINIDQFPTMSRSLGDLSETNHCGSKFKIQSSADPGTHNDATNPLTASHTWVCQGEQDSIGKNMINHQCLGSLYSNSRDDWILLLVPILSEKSPRCICPHDVPISVSSIPICGFEIKTHDDDHKPYH